MPTRPMDSTARGPIDIHVDGWYVRWRVRNLFFNRLVL